MLVIVRMLGKKHFCIYIFLGFLLGAVMRRLWEFASFIDQLSLKLMGVIKRSIKFTGVINVA